MKSVEAMAKEMKLSIEPNSGRVWRYPSGTVAIRQTTSLTWYTFNPAAVRPAQHSEPHDSEEEAMLWLYLKFKRITERWWESP